MDRCVRANGPGGRVRPPSPNGRYTHTQSTQPHSLSFTRPITQTGWKDLDDPTVWHLYVKDTIGTNVRSGDRVFECGCGVGAFLSCVQSIVHGLQLSGAVRTHTHVQTYTRVWGRVSVCVCVCV